MQTAFTLSARYRRQSARTRRLVSVLVRLYAAKRVTPKGDTTQLARIGVQVTLCKRLIEAVNRGN